ncbi:MAG: MFS transporter [Beijerinckiaceae bacterium]|nr:MFS transporter [Beijerinckiaceae bacterium]
MRILPLRKFLMSSKKPPILRCLSHPKFALFEGGLFPHYTTGWMMRVGAGWLAWELTGSPAWLGIIAAADLMPMLFLAPIAGAWTDRVNPLRLIRIAEAALLLHATMLAITMYLGLINIEILFALTVFAGVVYPFHSTARQSIIPLTVPREDFASAIALDSASFHSNRFLGPAIAAFVIPVYGVQGVFFAHMIGSSICLTTLLILRLPSPDRSKARGATLFSAVMEGMRYAAAHKGLRTMLALLVVASVCVRPLQDLLPGFAGGVFNAGAPGLAWLTSSVGVGAMLGAVYIAARGALAGLTSLAMLGYLGTAASALGFVATKNLWVAVFFSALLGFSLNVMSTSIQALMQLATDDRMRGRVMALYLLLFRGFPALGALALGFLADVIGLRTSIAISAALSLIFLAIMVPRRKAVAAQLETGARSTAADKPES